ncbi:RNA N6-adenosine-methyltransferase mettl16-like [Oscarella lobularis]|uniref:RNA N6-adenosine-methyltransferase mettl16-like n=1 Tax=Oscarella lobularis TaxID=121494 RepID=UPI003313D06D
MMHPRNVYRDKAKTDFTFLAQSCADFKTFVRFSKSGASYVNFKDPKATLALARALLQRDFDLKLFMPENDSRLVPTVPQKLNYIHWIEDLVGERENVSGIDIGTGASCIYPMLGAKMNGWSFIATEIDPVSKKYAGENVIQNKLDHLIRVKLVEVGDFLCGALKDDPCDAEYDFCMCNPPFYKELDSPANRTNRRSGPPGEFSGTSKEKVTEGGEVHFVTRIIEDSCKLKTKIQWYTSMLGCKSSIKPLLTLLKPQTSRVTVTEFVQGRTHRWAIGWSFSLSVQVPKDARMLRKRKAKRAFSFCVQASDIASAISDVRDIIGELNIDHTEERGGDSNEISLKCSAQYNTWIHSRRKRRAKAKHGQCTIDKEDLPEVNLEFYLRLKSNDDSNQKKSSKTTDSEHNVCLELEPISHFLSPEILHQLLVYLKNRLSM